MKALTASQAWPILVPVAMILLAQGTCLFLHARRRGGKAWFWGLWGMIQFPWPTIAYALLIWWRRRKLSSSD
ncbi:sigmaY antisigma factor component [Cohnella sp. CFH 77786]|uniref:hypothetical protein n=1 Tax=Cohnella sp. CFH 77786 TaxID=2662265 RepID=UPI001EB8E7EA|nr:hypothetical protein [Cohnella sp. CFH 77786]MBW5449395.1 sigmaY antisigma factor component [Cohnella sp. CFH 77786]